MSSTKIIVVTGASSSDFDISDEGTSVPFKSDYAQFPLPPR